MWEWQPFSHYSIQIVLDFRDTRAFKPEFHILFKKSNTSAEFHDFHVFIDSEEEMKDRHSVWNSSKKSHMNLKPKS